MNFYPLLLTPSLHVKVWGGRKLETVLGKPLPTDAPYGEAWELHESATVANGVYAGRTLDNLIAENAAGMLGSQVDASAGLPLLVKLLDASDWLSVQVHPNDEQARELEGQPRGKTEAWIILAADPGAALVIGVQPGIARDTFAEHIRADTVQTVLVRQPVQAGDVLFIPAGTIHAIGPGILLYEVQQTSDTTYRLYDWGRMGLDGEPRPLHIEKGVQVSNVASLPTIKHTADDPSATAEMVACDYFRTERHRISGDGLAFDTHGERFHSVTGIDGTVSIRVHGTETALSAGQTALIPAALGAYQLAGEGVVLRSWVVG